MTGSPPLRRGARQGLPHKERRRNNYISTSTMNLRRVEAKLKSLYARKNELEKKKTEFNAQIDEDLNYLNRQIVNFEKIRSQTLRYMKSIEEQMTLADELMNESRKKMPECTDTQVGSQ